MIKYHISVLSLRASRKKSNTKAIKSHAAAGRVRHIYEEYIKFGAKPRADMF